MSLTRGQESNSLLGQAMDAGRLAEAHAVIGDQIVKTVRLDDWVEVAGFNPKDVGLLKLDIQGSELKAFAGAEKLLETVRAIIVEVWHVNAYQDCPLFEEIDDYLHAKGFGRLGIALSHHPDLWNDAVYLKVGNGGEWETG